MSSRNWTKQEKETIQEHYCKSPKEELLKLLPDRTWQQIIRAAYRLRVSRFNEYSTKDFPNANVRWTKEEDEKLKENYSIATTEQLLELFPGRKRSSIIRRANRLKIKRDLSVIHTRRNRSDLIAPFSDEDSEYLKKHYTNTSGRDLAKHFNRPIHQIRKQAVSVLGLKKEFKRTHEKLYTPKSKRIKAWTEEELQILKDNYATIPSEGDLAILLPNRDWNSIVHKASFLKLKRDTKKIKPLVLKQTNSILPSNVHMYSEYTDEQLLRDYDNYKRKPYVITPEGTIKTNNNSAKLINHFTRSKQKATKKGYTSYYEVFCDSKDRQKVIERLQSRDQELTPANIKLGLRMISRAGGVTNFHPGLVHCCVEKLQKENITIYDPCMGWGGRLVGASGNSKVKKYIGVEPNTELFSELKELKNFIASHTQCQFDLNNTVAEDFDCSEKVDLIITSPPYFDLEIYCNEATQSINKYPEYEDWLSGFLYSMYDKCVEAMNDDGIICLNLKDNKAKKGKEPLVQPTIDYLSSKDWILSDQIPFHLKTNSWYTGQKGMINRSEALMIFRKKQ